MSYSKMRRAFCFLCQSVWMGGKNPQSLAKKINEKHILIEYVIKYLSSKLQILNPISVVKMFFCFCP